MRRLRGRLSRYLVAGLSLALATGLLAAVVKLSGNKTPVHPLLTANDTPLVPATQAKPATQPVDAGGISGGEKSAIDSPATRPIEPKPEIKPEPKPEVKPEPKREVPPSTASLVPLADAKSRMDAGEWVAARAILSEALIANRLTGDDISAARELLNKINQELVLGRKVGKDDPFAFAYTVQPGENLQKIAKNNLVTWELLCRVNGISDPRRLRALQTLKIMKGPFHAVVSKSKFTLDVYLGSPGQSGAAFVASYPVGLGKDDSTPLGTWKVINKLKNPTYYSPRGEGVFAADDPNNPLGEFWIGLQGIDARTSDKMSYGVHGTIDNNSIGKAESMGCIRLKNEDVAVLYEMLVEEKSTVVVKE